MQIVALENENKELVRRVEDIKKLYDEKDEQVAKL